VAKRTSPQAHSITWSLPYILENYQLQTFIFAAMRFQLNLIKMGKEEQHEV